MLPVWPGCDAAQPTVGASLERAAATHKVLGSSRTRHLEHLHAPAAASAPIACLLPDRRCWPARRRSRWLPLPRAAAGRSGLLCPPAPARRSCSRCPARRRTSLPCAAPAALAAGLRAATASPTCAPPSQPRPPARRRWLAGWVLGWLDVVYKYRIALPYIFKHSRWRARRSLYARKKLTCSA